MFRVRVREASARLSELTDLSAVFATLAETFSEDGSPRAEVRLRTSFLDGGLGAVDGQRRPRGADDDEVAVWTWNQAGMADVRP